MKDGGSDIFMRCITAQQSLDVSFSENAASRGNGKELRRFLGHAVQVRHVNIQQHGHLIDECAGTTGAVAVHPDVGTAVVVEKNDLGVFTTDFDKGFDIGEKCPDVMCGCHDFLNKRHFEYLSHPHPRGTGQCQIQLYITKFPEGLPENTPGCLHGFTLMAAVAGKNQSTLFVDDDYFDCSRADIDSGIIKNSALSCHISFSPAVGPSYLSVVFPVSLFLFRGR